MAKMPPKPRPPAGEPPSDSGPWPAYAPPPKIRPTPDSGHVVAAMGIAVVSVVVGAWAVFHWSVALGVTAAALMGFGFGGTAARWYDNYEDGWEE